jgi:hypothetical protein
MRKAKFWADGQQTGSYPETGLPEVVTRVAQAFIENSAVALGSVKRHSLTARSANGRAYARLSYCGVNCGLECFLRNARNFRNLNKIKG